MSERAPIRARSLGKRYPGPRDSWALRGVDFELDRGEALAVVGENGSGKSTLLDLLIGVTLPSAGQLEVEEPRAALLELGAGFFEELTGRENAVQAGLLAGLPPARARDAVSEVADFAELGDYFERPVRTYSAGMAMRLGFAVASSLAAPVTLVDEVLAVGDGYFQRKCIDRLLELRRSGTTLVIASHDLHALRSLCDRALWLERGQVRALGDAGDVLAEYEEHLRRRGASQELQPGRRGTGEVSIHQVRLLDATGAQIAELGWGETLRVEVDFEAHEPLDSPVMGVALFRDDGVYCFGPNTQHDGSLEGTYAGRYRLIAEFPELALLGGDYEVSVAFYDKDHVYAYAWDHRLYPLRLKADRPEHGVVALPHRFSVERLDS